MTLPIKNKRNKTETKIKSLSRDETDRIGLLVEKLMKSDMSFIVNRYLIRYRSVAQETFGWEDDDLIQHMRILLWKGVATFDSTKNVKMTTYLSTILYYQMGNFSKTCQTQKQKQSRMYCPEVLHHSEKTTEQSTPEDWLLYTQTFKVLLGNISNLETQVLVMHLIEENSLSEMESKLKVKRPVLISALKSLKEKIDKHLGGNHAKYQDHRSEGQPFSDDD